MDEKSIKEENELMNCLLEDESFRRPARVCKTMKPLSHAGPFSLLKNIVKNIQS